MNNSANRSYRWLFWTLALVGLCLDQGSKYGVFAWLNQPPYSAEVVADVFYLDVSYTKKVDPGDSSRSPLRTVSSDYLPTVNPGALWGIGGGENGNDLNHIFAGVSVIAAAAIVFWSFRRSTTGDLWLCMALGLILAGTVGNLYDRVVFLGVRDFLHWVYRYNFPVFNIADSCLVCGAALLLLQAFFTVPQEEKLESQPAAAGLETAAAAEPIPAEPEAAIAK